MWKARIPLWVVCSQSAVFWLSSKGDSSDALAPLTPRTPRLGSTQGDLPAIIKGMADSAVTVGCWQQPARWGPPSHERGLNRVECRWRWCCEYIEIIGQTLGMQVLTQRHRSPFCAAWTTLIGMLLPWHPPPSLLTKHMVCEHRVLMSIFPLNLTRAFLPSLSRRRLRLLRIWKQQKPSVQIAARWRYNNASFMFIICSSEILKIQKINN